MTPSGEPGDRAAGPVPSTVRLREAPVPPGWSAGELETLASVFETFVAGDAVRHAHLAAAVLLEVGEPDEVLQLRLTLRAFESRATNLALGLGAVRFRELDQAAREAYLLAWGTSRLGRRRTAYQLLKRLASFFAYADPGASGRNPTWERIGYAHVDEPVTSEPPVVVPLSDAGAGELRLEADVVVVGSGAGGGVVAARLAAAGRAVLVVEAGEYVPETELSPNELDGFDRLYLDHGLTATADLGVTVVAGGTLGGGTTVNWMTCLPLPAERRQAWAAEHGLEGLDGLEADADLARLQAELGFDPPHAMPPKDQLILDGAAALGWEAGPTARDGSGCGDCGACGFGCRRGTKRSGPRLHLAAAARQGARFLVRAPVGRVLVDAGHAVGVAGEVQRPDGSRRPFRVACRQVVVAAGALRTPGILWRSGLGHPAIGEHLHLHPVAVVGARLPHLVEMWHGVTQGARSLHFAAPGPADPEAPGPAHGGFVIESAPGHPGLIAEAFPWEGRDAAAELMDQMRWFAPLLAIVADRDGGRVSLSRHGVTRLEYRISERDTDTARRGLVEVARLARAGGATQLVALGTPPAWFGRHGHAANAPQTVRDSAWRAYLEELARFDFRPNRGALFSAHQMGTARAGADPRAHACDPWGRVRADRRGGLVAGLYVADTSLFPEACGVNPMVTAMQLAERTARAVLADS